MPDFLLYFALAAPFFTAIFLFLNSYGSRLHMVAGCLFVGSGFITLQLHFFLDQKFLEYPYMLLLHVPVVFFCAPLIYILFRQLLNWHFVINKKQIGHFLPAILVLLLFMPFYLLDEETKILVIKNNITEYPNLIFLVRSLMFFSYIYICIYLLWTTPAIFFFLKNFNSGSHRYIAIIVSLIILLLVAIFSILCGSIFNPQFKIFGFYLLLLFHLITFLITARQPDFLPVLRKQVFQIKYAKQRIDHKLRDPLRKKIIDLMNQEKLYLDDSLTLQKLADILQIRSDQLSEIFSEDFDIHFNQFVNHYRILAAKKMLTENPGISALAVGFAVGFNTKSAFYTAFKKNTGRTPQDFRKSSPNS